MILRLGVMDNFWYSDRMRLLFVADGRSPIARNWISYFLGREHEVYLASTFAGAVDLPLQGLEITPVAFSATSKTRTVANRRSPFAAGIRLRTAIRDFLGPLTIPRASRRLRELIGRVQPDLVHAMRIPYEGMLAADAYSGVPLLVSVWGNDFTLHAPSTALMRHYTTWTLRVAHALHADCQRDLRLGKRWGFDANRPALLMPGNGGVRTDVFYPPKVAMEEPIVLNPRGLRAYVRNDVFFQAIRLVIAKRPEARFICAAMAGQPEALNWVDKLRIGRSVELLSPLPHAEMARQFRHAQVMVSPSVHDGTPNSLLEAMACGCLPVAGDLESIREWITNGRNGLLADASSPQSMAEAMLEALENKNLRLRAAGLNQHVIAERAEYARCMAQAEEFYRQIIADG